MIKLIKLEPVLKSDHIVVELELMVKISVICGWTWVRDKTPTNYGITLAHDKSG